jgi:regulator of CtrA degradation
MTPEQAADDEHRLSGADICLDHSYNDDPALPHGLLSLMERSHRLYQRVARLEEMFVRRVLH